MATRLVGSRIRERREALGLKQRDVARQAGISASYLNLIEHNRRAIAGKVLIDIARVLELDVSGLLEGGDSDILRRLHTAAAADEKARAELDRAQEFVSRFPGWARLTAGLERRGAGLQRVIDGLSDRLAHDPFLAESLHEILSSVTAIHATSGILSQAQGDTMEALQRRRFQNNILDESARLSDLSRALVGYFDTLPQAGKSLSTPQDEVETFLGAHDFHFPVLETGENTDVWSLVAGDPALASQAAREMAAHILGEVASDARRLPLAQFTKTGAAFRFDVASLARAFAVTPATVMRRLAFLPPGTGAAPCGLIRCDGTGAILLRKAISGFALPRYGAACALWPLYQSLTRPHVPLASVLETNDARRFLAEAYCEYVDPASDVPVVRATMILRASDQGDAPPEVAALRRNPVPVGQSCRICPRSACVARREPSIHGPDA